MQGTILYAHARVFVRVCVVIPFILDVRLVDAPAGVTQDFSTFLLWCVPLSFLREGFSRSFPSSTVKSILCTNDLIVLHLLGIHIYIYYLFFVRKIPVRVTTPRFELTSHRDQLVVSARFRQILVEASRYKGHGLHRH